MTTRSLTTGLVALLMLFFGACQPGDRAVEDEADEDTAPEAVEVIAKDFEFEMPEQIPSGWNTFRFVNESDEEEHFFLLGYLPDGKTLTDYRSDIIEPFLSVWSRYDAGELSREEVGKALGEELPEWSEDVHLAGGAALTEPGRSSQVTLHLEPGTYAVECFVKTPQGTFHHDRGMLHQLVVTQDSTGASPPEADTELTLSEDGIGAPDSLLAGRRTLAVHMADTLSHNVNLFRIENDTTTVEEITSWMNWMDLAEFRAPAPGISMGGIQTLPAGATGYMTVELEPGRYVWASGYGDRGMVKEFTVD